MSWGERSCLWFYESKEAKPCSPEMGTCNVNCRHYRSDGKTQPDSKGSNLDPLVFCEQQMNCHIGTCDSCGSITDVTKINIRKFEYLCSLCIQGIAEGRKK
jgi:hypothetical protein